MKKIILFLIFCFPVFRGLAQADEWKVILLPDSSVTVSVPDFWKKKSPYQMFANYQRKYNVKVSSPKANTFLTVNVYDSSYMYNFTIDDAMLEEYRETHAKTVGRMGSVRKEVVSVDGIDVALLKFVCYDKKYHPRYSMILFFKRDSHHFYELNLFCGDFSVEEGRALSEKIVGSLRLN